MKRCPICGMAAPCPAECTKPPEMENITVAVRKVWRYWDERRWCYVYTKAECGPWQDEAEQVRVRVLNEIPGMILEVKVLRG